MKNKKDRDAHPSATEDLLNEITNVESSLTRIVESIRTEVREVCQVELKKGIWRKEVVKGIRADYDVTWRVCDVLQKTGFGEYRYCEVCYTPKGTIIKLANLSTRVLTLSDFIKIVKEALELKNRVNNTLKDEAQQLMQILQTVQKKEKH